MNIDTLKSLQQRIREATGPDRALDVAILDALSDPNSIVLPLYTTDPDGLGACVALLNEKFPSGHWARSPDGTFRVFNKGWTFSSEPLANDCLTFLDAIVSAVIAGKEAKEKADV